MKAKIAILLILSIFFLAGCKTSGPCPKVDSIVYVRTPFGPMSVLIQKDHFAPEKEGTSWDEYKPEEIPGPEPESQDSEEGTI